MTRPDVKALADKYFLKTADQLAKEPPKAKAPEPPAPRKERVRWSYGKKEDFRRWGIAALYVAGPKAPVPRGIGDNRLGWPLRFGTMRTWEDSITRSMDAAAPYHWQGVWFRIWTPSMPHSHQLLALLVDALVPSEDIESESGSLAHEITRWIMAERTAERVKNSWLDVGPDFDLPMPDRKVEQLLGLTPLARNATTLQVRERRFQLVRHKFKTAIIDLACRHAIETWDDDGVERALDSWEKDRMAKAVKLGGTRGR
jgi:hypothetical protein